MPTPQEATNKDLVLKAFDALLNRKDLSAAETYWSPDYIQHSAMLPPGRDGLVAALKSMPDLRYEFGVALATDDLVVIHGRITGMGQPDATIVADMVRVKDGKIVEHWDTMQPEAKETPGRRPMFGDRFPS